MLFWVFGYREGEPNYMSWTECDTTNKDKAINHLYEVMQRDEAESLSDGKEFEILDMIEITNTLEYVIADGYGQPYHYGVGCEEC